MKCFCSLIVRKEHLAAWKAIQLNDELVQLVTPRGAVDLKVACITTNRGGTITVELTDGSR